MLYGTGCNFPKKDIRNYRFKRSYVASMKYPEKFILPKLGTVKNQGIINSCVAYSMSSILEYHDNNNTTLSTNFIYGIKRKLFIDTKSGMRLDQACQIALHYGDMEYSDCPANNEVPDCFELAEEAMQNSDKLAKCQRHRIKSYIECNTDNEIKYALLNYGPVLACSRWNNDYQTSVTGWLFFDESKKYDYYSFVIVGWNYSGWICQSSFGSDFGHHGLFVIPFYEMVEQAFAINCSKDYQNDVKKFTHIRKFKLLCSLLNMCYNSLYRAMALFLDRIDAYFF